jgi:hypothetical protein
MKNIKWVGHCSACTRDEPGLHTDSFASDDAENHFRAHGYNTELRDGCVVAWERQDDLRSDGSGDDHRAGVAFPPGSLDIPSSHSWVSSHPDAFKAGW